MSFEAGQSAGDYEFAGVLETTGSRRAYRVRNTVADRMEVLRVLPTELKSDREEAERFLREIDVHSRLSHPNIVSFYTTAEIGGDLVMTSEYFEGITLEKRLEAGPMPLPET